MKGIEFDIAFEVPNEQEALGIPTKQEYDIDKGYIFPQHIVSINPATDERMTTVRMVGGHSLFVVGSYGEVKEILERF